MNAQRISMLLGLIWSTATAFGSGGAERELIRDPHFQQGFQLLAPRPGKRVVYAELATTSELRPAWDLAQWSSKWPLNCENCVRLPNGLICSNQAKRVVIGIPGKPEADLSLFVNTGVEYARPRQSTAEPWVHLLTQQDIADPPSLGAIAACNFHIEARLKRSKLIGTNDYSPSLHAAQFLVYLTIANGNPKASGYQECFWFGIPLYDNRTLVVPAYEAQDFGHTKLFIFTPASDRFAARSTHNCEWITFQKDLLPLMREGLEHARGKGFIKGSADLADYRPLGIFLGWEVPGVFEVELQIRELSLKAVPK